MVVVVVSRTQFRHSTVVAEVVSTVCVTINQIIRFVVVEFAVLQHKRTLSIMEECCV